MSLNNYRGEELIRLKRILIIPLLRHPDIKLVSYKFPSELPENVEYIEKGYPSHKKLKSK